MTATIEYMYTLYSVAASCEKHDTACLFNQLKRQGTRTTVPVYRKYNPAVGYK